MKHTLFLAMSSFGLVAATLAGCQDQAGSGGGRRDYIRAVGSSTVYPFATAAAERFIQDNAGMKSPIIESTGTGAGMKLFCAGVGIQHPDIENASRRMKKSEFDQCAANGVKEIVELQIGVDGLALAASKEGPAFALTPKHIYEALAANPYGKGENKTAKWSDIDPSLPAVAISVYGPPTTSGTRDSLSELILEKGCQSDPAMKALKEEDEDKYKAVCTRVREDGKYVDSGENDNLIVSKVASNPNSVGVFGYSFLEENLDKLKDIPLNGIPATYENVASGKYPGARPLYLYVKKAHLQAIPGLRPYLEAFEKGWGPGGYLVKRGMVAAQDDVRQQNAGIVKSLAAVDGSTLK